jgi:HK97 family phage prohead protease
MEIERRAIDSLAVNKNKIVGRPVVYNSRSKDLGGFEEIIAPFAFRDSIKGDVRALIEHDHTKILGRTTSGTLSIKEDDNGLLIEIDPPNTRTATELMESISRGDIAGMSFGFTVPPQGDVWNFDSNLALRTVNQAILHEVTVTSMPAYQATDVSIAMRSMQTNRPPNLEMMILTMEANRL